MTQLRLISFCNVIYKIYSKVLTNTLKVVLPKIISQNHSAFVFGRLISDNCMVASEIAHYMHKKNSGWDGVMALKLDINKAYDRIEWGFLDQIMRKMSLTEEWIQLIMECVLTVTYSFKLTASRWSMFNLKEVYNKGILFPISYLFFV